MAKVATKAKRVLRDQTGLFLMGRAEDGRYTYQSVPVVGYASNNVHLTHTQRVGLAVVHQLLAIEYGGAYEVYPMTRSNFAQGYGTYNRKRQWLARWILAKIGTAFLAKDDVMDFWRSGGFGTVAHEVGHNFQQYGTKPHGKEFKLQETKARVRIEARLRKHGWPKLDMRKLRDSKVS
jgi:hypothetical protein